MVCAMQVVAIQSSDEHLRGSVLKYMPNVLFNETMDYGWANDS